MENIQHETSWDDVVCPICLDFPHNGVLLQCSSYEKGCRPFVCDTDHLHSNCLDRFKTAYGMSSGSRGEVTGWIIDDKARIHWNEKKRCCDEHRCAFKGNFFELRQHAQLEHPHACPSKVDPARQLDWENFQQSNEFEDFPGDEGHWWTSCILYQVFDNFRTSRNRRRSRASDSRRGSRNSIYQASNSDEVTAQGVQLIITVLEDDGPASMTIRSAWTPDPSILVSLCLARSGVKTVVVEAAEGLGCITFIWK
ncbi:hypothetical protein Vadar_022936 [Vaccinium darrowii]|uniref:Uncharacterized protein n=1 Tax=Vaccinium darrowii TaxID=229202 RepID=A0ACB7Y2N9_9ERIC|nr:hypothetical protein Vadar_022936 [Vaccinium darrowii]